MIVADASGPQGLNGRIHYVLQNPRGMKLDHGDPTAQLGMALPFDLPGRVQDQQAGARDCRLEFGQGMLKRLPSAQCPSRGYFP